MIALMMSLVVLFPILVFTRKKLLAGKYLMLNFVFSLLIFPGYMTFEDYGLTMEYWGMPFLILSGLVFFAGCSLLNQKQVRGLIFFTLLFLSLEVFFTTDNLIIFYVAFEAATLFMFLMILDEGKTLERFEAALSLFVYMVFFSLPLLYVILSMLYNSETSSMGLISSLLGEFEWYLFFLAMLGFLVKGPVYGVHIWLTKAHVHGSLLTSLILSGILLKMSVFGIIKLESMMKFSFKGIEIPLFYLVLWGSILSVGMTVKQSDSKSFVAYSSIGVMGLSLLGSFLNSLDGQMSSLLIMFGHGLSSPILFTMVYLFKESQGSRTMVLQNGGGLHLSSIKYLVFFACCMNIPVPYTFSFLGEVLLMNSVTWSFYILVLVLVVIFLGSCYNMFFYYCLTSFNNPFFNKGVNLHSMYLLPVSIFLISYLMIVKSSMFSSSEITHFSLTSSMYFLYYLNNLLKHSVKRMQMIKLRLQSVNTSF